MSEISPSVPHGGTLVNLLAQGDAAAALAAEAANLPRVLPSERELSDLEMLAVGALSPLTGFQGERDYHSVLDSMHLDGGLAWAIPVVLSLSDDDALGLERRRDRDALDAGTEERPLENHAGIRVFECDVERDHFVGGDEGLQVCPPSWGVSIAPPPDGGKSEFCRPLPFRTLGRPR